MITCNHGIFFSYLVESVFRQLLLLLLQPLLLLLLLQLQQLLLLFLLLKGPERVPDLLHGLGVVPRAMGGGAASTPSSGGLLGPARGLKKQRKYIIFFKSFRYVKVRKRKYVAMW